MAEGNPLKDLYFSIEDKYYDLLDSLDKAGVPVYSVTDAIESQGIPSMPVMLLLVLGAIAVPAALFLGANPLAPGAISLNVSVIDAAGKPVSEAFVSAAFGGEKLSFTTLEDGKASFSVPANTEVTLAAEKKGFEAFSLTFTTGSEAVSRDAVLVAVERMLKFTILNPDGTPGKMVIVAKHVDGTQTTHPCDGSCKVPFKEGAVYQTENGQLISVPESGDPAPVYLQQAPTTGTGTLIVSITDSVTKAPVPNAFVEARSANSGVLKSSTKGDSEGSAKLENLEATRVYVVVKADGYLSSNTFSAPVTIKAGEVQQLKVELEKASGTIVVTVVEGESKPLQGVTVSSNPVDDASNVSTYTTAADGKVTVPVDVQKKYKLILSKSGYKDFSVASADPGKAYTYKLEKLDSVDPAKVTRLSVSVTDNQGFAVPNATVALHTVQTVKGILQVSPSPFKPAASTDANGKAAFVGLPVGTDFIVKAAYAQFDANSEVIKFSSEGEQKSVTLKLKLTPIIVTAEVKAENGSVVSGAQLSFQDATGTLTALENTTGGDGKTTTVFLFEGQRGSFVVRASGYREVTTEPVTIASGGLYTITLKESDKIVSGESNGAQVVYRGVYKNCSDELPFSGSIASGQNYCLKFQAISKGSDGGSLGFAALGATNKFADYAHFVAFSSTSDFVPSIPTGGARGAVEWLVKGPESVYFGLEFKVKAGIEQGTEIPLSVKAWKKVGTSCFGETSTESSACDASSLTGAKELSPKIVIGTMDVQPVGCTPEAPFYATITDPSGQVKRLSNATDYSSDEFPTLLLGEEASIEVQVCNPGTSVVSGASFDFYHGTVSVLSGSNLVIKDQEQKTFTIKSYSLKNIGVATTTVEEKTGQSLNSFSKASGDIAVGGKLVFTAKVKAEKSAANAAWSVGLVKSSRYVTPPSFKEFNVESRAAGNFDVLITSPAEAQLGKENTIVVQTFINDKITTLPLADSGLALKASFLSAAGGKIEKTNWTEDFQKQQYSIKVTPQNEGSPIKVSGQFPGYGSVEKEIPITAENLAKVIPIGPQEPINVDELPTGGLTGPIAVIVKAAVEGSTGSIIGTPTWDSTAERPENIANNDTGGVRVEKLEVSKASFGSSDETAGAITGTLRIPKNSYPEDFKIRVTFQLKLTAATEASVITAEIPVSLFSPTIQPTPEGCLEITITPEGKATISETSGAYKDVEVTNKCQRELKDVNLNISTGFGNAGTIFSNSIFSNGQKNVVIGTLQHNTGQIVNLNVGYEPQAGQVGDGAANDVKITANGAYTLLGGKAIATNSKAFNAEFSSFACITNSFISPVSFPNRDRGTLAQTTFNVRNDCTEKVNVSISSFAETGIEQLSFNPSFFVLEAGKETQVNASLVLQPSFLLRDFKQKTIVFLSKPVSSFDSLAELPVEQLGLTPCFTTKTQASCAVVGEGSTGSQVDLLAASTACDFKDWEQYLCAFTGSTCTPLIEKTLVSSGNITQCGRPQIELKRDAARSTFYGVLSETASGSDISSAGKVECNYTIQWETAFPGLGLGDQSQHPAKFYSQESEFKMAGTQCDYNPGTQKYAFNLQLTHKSGDSVSQIKSADLTNCTGNACVVDQTKAVIDAIVAKPTTVRLSGCDNDVVVKDSTAAPLSTEISSNCKTIPCTQFNYCASPTQYCGPAGTCVACTENSHCTNPSQPTCLGNVCSSVPCTAGGNECDGYASTPVCGPNGRCVECTEANATACTTQKPVCNTAKSKCVQCTDSSQCSGTTPNCNTQSNTCVANPPCTNDAGCASVSGLPRCVGGVCVACKPQTQAQDCGTANTCDSNYTCKPCVKAKQADGNTDVANEKGLCGNKKDDDCDGYTDQADTDCVKQPSPGGSTGSGNAGYDGIVMDFVLIGTSWDYSNIGLDTYASIGTAPPSGGRWAFVSSAAYTGDLKGSEADGLTGADKKCQDLASAAGLQGSYKALLSVNQTTGNAKDRIQPICSSYALYNRNSQLVAGNCSDLWDGTLGNAIEYDETGTKVTSLLAVHTGTKSDGSYFTSGSCNDWTCSTGSGCEGTEGISSSKNSSWIQSSSGTSPASCSTQVRIYCFQADL